MVLSRVHDLSSQLINDDTGQSLVQVSSRNLSSAKGKPMTEAAKLVGGAIAEKAKGTGVEKVVFDRGGYIYTGIVAALADGAREGGLVF